MTDRHDLARWALGADPPLGGELIWGDHEGVIAHHVDFVGQAVPQGIGKVGKGRWAASNAPDLAMNGLRGGNDGCAGKLTEELMPKADTQDRPAWTQQGGALQEGCADAGLGGITRPGRDHKAGGGAFQGFLRGHGLVAHDLDLCSLHGQRLGQVERERVIVVDEQQPHRAALPQVAGLRQGRRLPLGSSTNTTRLACVAGLTWRGIPPTVPPMQLARVLGTVVASQKYEGLSGAKLLLVQPLDHAQRSVGEPSVAVDTVQAGPGELVYTVGSREAALALEPSFVPVDLTIVGVVDDVSATSSKASGGCFSSVRSAVPARRS